MNKYKLTYKPFGNYALLIEWPQEISTKILEDIRLFVHEISLNKIKHILEVNFIYSSLLVIYNYKKTNFNLLKNELDTLYNKPFNSKISKGNLWKIPVCYNKDFGMDLELLASEKKITTAKIISLHSNSIYTVFGIGFLPGFLYLGGLNNQLFFPRKSTPRSNIEQGSVAIGGNQTGIYPQNSPGGWNIIGKTPVSIFNKEAKIPCKIAAGDSVQFLPISKENFYEIQKQVIKGTYNLKQFKND